MCKTMSSELIINRLNGKVEVSEPELVCDNESSLGPIDEPLDSRNIPSSFNVISRTEEIGKCHRSEFCAGCVDTVIVSRTDFISGLVLPVLTMLAKFR